MWEWEWEFEPELNTKHILPQSQDSLFNSAGHIVLDTACLFE